MKIVYVGPFPEVVFFEGQIDRYATNGDPIEVPDELGASLLEQPDNWQPVKAPVKKSDD